MANFRLSREKRQATKLKSAKFQKKEEISSKRYHIENL